MDALTILGWILGIFLWTAYILAGVWFGWIVATMIQKIRDFIHTDNVQPIIIGDTEAREAIKAIRAAQDQARFDRIRARAKKSKVEPEETDQEVAYCICKNPVSTHPEYFYGLRPGYHGVSIPKILWIPLQSQGLRMTMTEARKWMNLIGRGKGSEGTFIVPSAVQERVPAEELPIAVRTPTGILTMQNDPIDLTEALEALGGA